MSNTSGNEYSRREQGGQQERPQGKGASSAHYSQYTSDQGSRRDSILRSYAEQDAARARNVRMYSQAVSQAYRETSSRASDRAAQRRALVATQREQRAAYEAKRRAEAEVERARRESAAAEQAKRERRPRRVVPPLSSQESYDRTRSSVEGYERARASRDALSEARSRTPNRDIIDGRGSIDSRAFNETHELVGYSIDDRDRPEAAVGKIESHNRWHSRAGQGFNASPRPQQMKVNNRGRGGASSRSMMGSQGSFGDRGGFLDLIAGLPLPVKIGIPILIVLIVILAIYVF